MQIHEHMHAYVCFIVLQLLPVTSKLVDLILEGQMRVAQGIMRVCHDLAEGVAHTIPQYLSLALPLCFLLG